MKEESKRRRRSIKPNKKRLVLQAAGSIAPSVASRENDRRRGPGSEANGSGGRQQLDEHGEDEQDELLEGGEKEDEPKSEDELHEEKEDEFANSPLRLRAESSLGTDATRDAYQPQEGEEGDTERARVEPGAATGRQRPSRAERGRSSTGEGAQRGPYIRRDMRNAIRGEGLLVLGVVVEELIRYQLEQAGYRPRALEGGEMQDEPSAPSAEPESDANEDEPDA